MIIKQSPLTECHRGFTLIELIMVIAVASILLSAAVPSWMNVTSSNKVTTASNSLITTLNLGKSEAIRSGVNTVLCKRADNSTCGDNSTSWEQGWILFVDNDNDAVLDAGEKIVRVQDNLASDLNFTLVGAGTSNNFVRFTPRGRANEQGRFCFENSYNESNSRAVSINYAGRFYSEKRNATNHCAAS